MNQLELIINITHTLNTISFLLWIYITYIQIEDIIDICYGVVNCFVDLPPPRHMIWDRQELLRRAQEQQVLEQQQRQRQLESQGVKSTKFDRTICRFDKVSTLTS